MDRPAKKKKTGNAKSATVTTTVAVTKVTASTTPSPTVTAMPASPVAPMSAIAARRHAMMLAAQAAAASAASTPEPQETNDEDDEGDKVSLESGDEAGAGDDDGDDDGGANSSDSSGENDNSDDDDNNIGGQRSRLSSRNTSSSRQDRRDRKLYMDPQSVSTWQPSRFNIAYPNSNRPEVIVVGMKAGESLVFQGAAFVTPILGEAVVQGNVLSGKGYKGNHRKRSGGENQTLQVNFSSLQSYPVYSPRTHALTTIDSIRLSQTEKKKLLYLGKGEAVSSPLAATAALPSSSLQELVEPLLSQLNLQDFDSVLAIQSAVSTGIFGIEKVVPLFKGILSRGKQRPLNVLSTRDMTEEQQMQQKLVHALEGFHPILEPTEGVAALRIPDTWQNAIQALIDSTWTDRGDAVQRPPVAVVCGGKKLGKSTFSRVLLNRMLNRYRRVAFLECDIGQSEFSPVGMVALHILERPALGPPFTHFRPPRRAFYVGHSTPRDDPDYYMMCIQELVRTYFEEISHTRHWDEDDEYHSDTENGDDDHIPLIVNTQGWIKGMGLDLLLQLLNCARASHIFGFHSASNPESNLPSPFFDFLKAQANQIHPPMFHYVGAVVLGDDNNLSPFSKFHPADHRTLALVSYFYAKQQLLPTAAAGAGPTAESQEEDRNQWDFTQALIVRRPWCWDWRQAKGVWVLFDQVPPSQILHALNASVVALLGDKESMDEESMDEDEGNGVKDEDKANNSMENQGQDSERGDQGTQAPPLEPETEATITPPNYFPLGQYPPPPPALTTCHGLAIIRSIQPATHSLHILTPISPSTLARCNGI
ncbi:Polynucleotide 5'-hydroxyl-kinase grc3, partial [Actinomortierella ambigua]